MTTVTRHLHETAHALRQEFDRSFAQAPHAETAQREGLLAIRLGGDPYAVRLTEVRGLYVDRSIVPLPTPVPQLLGVTGFRGQIAPVYDLASLCGYARAPGTRWLILLKSQEPLALAFASFEMHLSIRSEQIVSTLDDRPASYAKSDTAFHTAHCDDAIRPIIDLPTLIRNIRRQADSFIQKKGDQP